MFEFYNDLESALGFDTLWLSREDCFWVFRWRFGKFHLNHRIRCDDLDGLIKSQGSKSVASTIGHYMREQARAKG